LEQGLAPKEFRWRRLVWSRHRRLAVLDDARQGRGLERHEVRARRFNELLLQGRAESDEAKRAPIYAEMQKIVHDEGGLIIVAFADYINGVSNKLQFGEVGGIYPMDNFKLAERWWMA